MNKGVLIIITISFSVGLTVGQWSTFYALNPDRIRSEAYKMAGLSYKYGCVRAGGEKCLSRSDEFEAGLRKQLPMDEIEDN